MTSTPVFEFQPTFKKTLLPNGIKVVTEHHPFTRCVSAGVYVDVGSRDESIDLAGAAHFIEHLVFKGTKKRSGFEIAQSLEKVGGELNAYTSREYTCFHAGCLKEHLHLALDVLMDLVGGATFKTTDFEVERGVVSAEIDMSADDFEDYIYDLFFESAYPNHSLGRPILGTHESLQSMTRKKLMDYYQSRYRSKNLILSVAGHVDHDEVVQMVRRTLGKVAGGGRVITPKRVRPQFKPFRRFVHRPSEQVHILMGGESCSYRHKYRFESYIVNALLGGGMTSRLYQSIREKKGLAYSVYSFLISFTDSGLLTYYGSTAPKNVGQVLASMKRELERFYDKGISKKELENFKTQVKGQILLGADDVENRMNSLAVNEMIFGHYRAVDDVIADIEKVSVGSVRAYIDEYFDFKRMGLLLLGDLDRADAEKWLEKF